MFFPQNLRKKNSDFLVVIYFMGGGRKFHNVALVGLELNVELKEASDAKNPSALATRVLELQAEATK